jgi:hypothetical protein
VQKLFKLYHVSYFPIVPLQAKLRCVFIHHTFVCSQIHIDCMSKCDILCDFIWGLKIVFNEWGLSCREV